MPRKKKNNRFRVYSEEVKHQFTNHWDLDYLNSEELDQLHLAQDFPREGGDADSRTRNPASSNIFSRFIEIVRTAIAR